MSMAPLCWLWSRLAGKQREVAGLQDLNSRLFSRFQGMRDLLARNEEKLSHDKLRGRQYLSTPAV